MTKTEEDRWLADLGLRAAQLKYAKGSGEFGPCALIEHEECTASKSRGRPEQITVLGWSLCTYCYSQEVEFLGWY